jgi:hypothetical protein
LIHDVESLWSPEYSQYDSCEYHRYCCPYCHHHERYDYFDSTSCTRSHDNDFGRQNQKFAV